MEIQKKITRGEKPGQREKVYIDESSVVRHAVA
jgi:hypothetical protein